MAPALPFTVIIPAFNEEAVIGRCLATLLADAPAGHAMEIIVAANGCADRTVEVAKAIAPDARILDLAEGSKTQAINAANAIARHFPRIYLDADVECSYATAMALAVALDDPGAMTAAPAIRIDASKASWLMQAYYRVWLKLPYASSGNGGAGCYALSEAALRQIGEFPEIIGDDIWIHTRFPKTAKRYVAQDARGNAVFTTVYPPRTAREQVRIEARRQIGNAQVLQDHPSPHNIKAGGGGALRHAIENGSHPLDMVVYFSMKICSRLLGRLERWRGRGAQWSRDLTSRNA